MNEIRIITNSLKELKSVKAIALIGSYALGFADQYTKDFELVVFVSKIPKKDRRKKILAPFIKSWNSAYDVQESFDVFDVGIFKDCSVTYQRKREIEYFVEQFRKGKWIAQQLIDYIFYSKPLYDPDKLLKKWKQIMRKYPDWLRRQEVNLLTGIFRFTRSDMIEKERKRGNINFLNDKLASVKIMLDKVVFALNKTYYHPKWTFKFYPKFKLLPRDFIPLIEKFNDLNGLPFKKKVKIIDHIAFEIYKIAKKEIPDLNIITRF